MNHPLLVEEVELRSFRCFEHLKCPFTEAMTLCEGNNGTGKTALLEALAYACYLRSFRTHAPRELVKWGGEGFYVHLKGRNEVPWELSVAVAGNKRLVRFNGTSITSFRDLFSSYKSITVVGDDLKLVAGFPEERRLFLDQALTIAQQSYGGLLSNLRAVVKQRNALLAHHTVEPNVYDVWTERLMALSAQVRAERQSYVEQLEHKVSELSSLMQPFGLSVPPLSIEYREAPWTAELYEKELRFHRSLCGAHLDDISIMWDIRSARLFASRGQQKLIVILLKIAQAALLAPEKPLLLVDDFATDFDTRTLSALLHLIAHLGAQTIFTAPAGNPLRSLLTAFPHSIINMQEHRIPAHPLHLPQVSTQL